jgi:hypothetical protein
VCIWGLIAERRTNVEYRAFNDQNVSVSGSEFSFELRFYILTDPGELAWFRAHGMPDPSGLVPHLRSSPSDDDFKGYFSFFNAYRSNADLTRWVEHEGRRVYTQYVLSHPHRIASRVLLDLPYMLVPPRSQFVYAPPVRAVLPQPVEHMLFDTTTSDQPTPASYGDVALLIATCITVGAFAVGRRVDRRLIAIGAGTVGLMLTESVIVVLGSAVEIARHDLPASILLRLGLWILILASVDALLVRQQTGSRMSRP